MPDMYDKLGEMLNEALESGEIPQENSNSGPEDVVVEFSQSECIETTDSGPDNLTEKNSQKEKKTVKKKKTKAIPTGEVIKMHKYTYNMQFSPEIQKALQTLDVAYPFIQKDITAAYHKKLKEVHPDTQNTIQTSKDVQNIRQLTIDEIKDCYKILCDFFSTK